VAWYFLAMPLPPDVRRARRAEASRNKERPEIRRHACLNDGKLYWKTRPNKKFCSRKCKEEFNRYGSAFGPLRDWLTKLIEKNAKGEAVRQFTAYLSSKDFRRELAAAGFIHRSQLKPKPAELTVEFLRESVFRLMARVERFEQAHPPTPAELPPPREPRP
jgi:hypothetical protein